jgi:hypothetical protein
MHDGTINSLEKVLLFYYRGAPEASSDGLANEAPDLRGQSYADIPYLLAFLESLTGRPPDGTPPTLPPGPTPKKR